MCGRYALHADEKEIVSHFNLKRGFAMQPRYNIAPGQVVPIILEWGTQIEFSTWGFIASWIKSDNDKNPKGHINARMETIFEKPTFKTAITHQRCLVPASGYYEWRQFGAKKQPYYIVLKQQPIIAFAGIWSIWRAPDGQEIRTCAIVTAEASEALFKLHERMPVIISPENYQNWLAKDTAFSDLAKHLADISPENIGVKPVSTSMNYPQFDGIACIQSLS